MKKTEKKAGLFKMFWNSFVDCFTPANFSWVKKEAEVLDKRFTPTHTEERVFHLAYPPIIGRREERVPDRWEFLVKVNDKKTFGPTLLSPPRRNDKPRWASVSKEAFEKTSKGDKVKVKCFVDGRGMIYEARGA